MTVNISDANITSIRLADQSVRPTAPATNFVRLYANANGDIGTVKGPTSGGGILIATSPATGDYTFTIDGTGTAARLNANQTFTGTNQFNQNIVLANGIGISFAATSDGTGTMTSEILADYEEGTWTPTVVGSTAAGTATYVSRSGFYTKIGRLVTVQFQVGYQSHDGTGDLRIGGLPYTSNSTSLNEAFGAILANSLNWTGGTMLTIAVLANSSQVRIFGSTDNAALSTQQCVNQAGTANIYGTISYNA
jgi:hypothetical protein